MTYPDWLDPSGICDPEEADYWLTLPASEEERERMLATVRSTDEFGRPCWRAKYPDAKHTGQRIPMKNPPASDATWHPSADMPECKPAPKCPSP